MFISEKTISPKIKAEARRRAVGVPVEVMELVLQVRAEKKAEKIAENENSSRH